MDDASSKRLLKTTIQEFTRDDCMSMAAALAYYTVLALPAVLVIIVTVAGLVWDVKAVRGKIGQEFAGVVGKGGQEQVETMIEKANQPGKGTLAALLGTILLISGATGAMAQLQQALNRAWEVQPDPRRGGIKHFIGKRILSLGMILTIAFLLLVSLVLTTFLSAAGGYLERLLPEGIAGWVPVAIHLAVSYVIVFLLFAAMLKWLPDATIRWRDVWVGACVTAALFLAGKFLLGLYLGHKDPGAYGPAASLVLIMLWVYYSAVIFLLGAEFTQVWAQRGGKRIPPAPGAVKSVPERPTASPARAGSGQRAAT